MFSYDLDLNLQQMLGFLLGGFILLFEKLNIECHPDTTAILIFYQSARLSSNQREMWLNHSRK